MTATVFTEDNYSLTVRNISSHAFIKAVFHPNTGNEDPLWNCIAWSDRMVALLGIR